MVFQRDSQLVFITLKFSKSFFTRGNVGHTLRRARLAFKIAAAFARAVPFCNFAAGPETFFATGFLAPAGAFGLGLVPVDFLTGFPSLPLAIVFLTAGFLATGFLAAAAGLAVFFAGSAFLAVSAFFAGAAGFFSAGFAAGLSVFLAVDAPAAAGFLSFLSDDSPATRKVIKLIFCIKDEVRYKQFFLIFLSNSFKHVKVILNS